MLGRYVAGTLLILGAAMVVAPDRPPKKAVLAVAVTRTEAAPVALASTKSSAMAAALRQSALASAEVNKDAPADAVAVERGVEAAVLRAVAPAPGQGLEARAEVTEFSMTAAVDTDNTAFSAFAPLTKLELAVAPATETAAPVVEATAPAAENATQPALVEREPRRLFVTGSKVNVRAGPSTQFRVVGSVSYGDAVEVVTFEGRGWARIRMGNGETTGYMSRKFLASDLTGG